MGIGSGDEKSHGLDSVYITRIWVLLRHFIHKKSEISSPLSESFSFTERVPLCRLLTDSTLTSDTGSQ